MDAPGYGESRLTGRIVHILVVDDRTLTRELLVHRLNSESDLVADGLDSPEACIERARRRPPDVILMRADMDGSSPFSAVRTIAAGNPATAILFFSQRVCDTHLERSFAVKASGFLCEYDSLAGLLEGLRQVADGRTCFSPHAVARMTIDADPSQPGSDPRTLSSLLSEREKEVLVHVAEGLSSKEIARRMHLTPKTVESHTSRLMHKLKVRERVSLTRFAIREGFVSP